jgi:hypothetical protein
VTVQDRTTDPGYTAAMDQKQAAIAELRALGVPVERAVAIVHRVYSAGRDRGLYLGVRRRAHPFSRPAPDGPDHGRRNRP